MQRRCPAARPSDQTTAAVREAVFDSPLWEPPDIIDGIPQALQSLSRRGLRMAVVCNTGLAPGPVLERMLHARNLGPHFQAFAWSDVVRSWKPGPEIFQAALDQLAIPPEESAFIGDTPEADIIGARNLGFALTIQVGQKHIPGVQPHLSLPSVAHLPAALEPHL